MLHVDRWHSAKYSSRCAHCMNDVIRGDTVLISYVKPHSHRRVLCRPCGRRALVKQVVASETQREAVAHMYRSGFTCS